MIGGVGMMRCVSFYTLTGLCTLCLALPLFETLLGTTAAATDLALRFSPPSLAHPLGTDELGRDIFLRLLEGGRISLTVGIVSAILCAVIGSCIGMAAGYFGGKTDAFLMRLTDMLIALPALPLLIVLSAVDGSKLGLDMSSPAASVYKIIALVTLFGWTGVARLTRARTRSLREMDFVLSARALGVSDARIIRRHILPNLSGTVIVAATLAAGTIIMTESVLSFLGLGIAPPMASWGNMLTTAEDSIWEYPWLAVYPGMMIFVTVMAFNLLGDRWQARMNPKKGLS
jgi:peptide/nickel transport system permease protein